jgi:hypothetical protein
MRFKIDLQMFAWLVSACTVRTVRRVIPESSFHGTRRAVETDILSGLKCEGLSPQLSSTIVRFDLK